ncbi:saccharopine dehydrogenase NADP-binding domain-containing protein [Mycobacterium sp. TJFP1]
MTIAVYGASGHTGKLIIDELVSRGVQPVLIGRNQERLHATAAEAGLSENVVRRASLDEDALMNTLVDVDVVISAVAPFIDFGEPIVRAAIASRTHYLDISGEQQFVKRIIERFDRPATQAGVTVVPMINDGGMIGDMLSAVAAERLEHVDTVTLVHRISGGVGISRGSGRTALANKDSWFRPLTYVEGQWRSDTPEKATAFTFPGDSAPSEVIVSALTEIVTVPRHVRANYVQGLAEPALTAMFANVTSDIVAAMPEYPLDDADNRDEFCVVAEVLGPDGGVRSFVQGSGTYRVTAVAAAEAAIHLAERGTNKGVLAPSQAFSAKDFLDSLAPHAKWQVTEIEDLPHDH